MVLRRLAIILVMTWTIILHRLMGQKYLGLTSDFTLGITTMCVWLSEERSLPWYLRISKTMCVWLSEKEGRHTVGPGGLCQVSV